MYGAAVAPALRSVFGVLLALAVSAPVLLDAERDSFPFSTYPMFARVLNKPHLVYAEGYRGRGQVTRLPPELVANDEPMQAMRTLKLTAKEGKAALKALCAQIAARVARDRRYGEVRRVHIVRAEFDPIRYFEAEPAPEQSERLVQCSVAR